MTCKRGHDLLKHGKIKGECRECARERDRRTYAKDPSIKRNADLKRAYGITLDEYNKQFAKQEGKCLICQRHQSETGRILYVDHCHAKKNVRGLLCISCNARLGWYENNVKNIVLYLAGKL